MNAFCSSLARPTTVLRALISALVGVVLLSSIGVSNASAQVADDQVTAPVTFLQGVGGRSLDVYIDGKRAMRSVSFGSFSSQLELAEGKHRIDLREAGAKRRSKRIARISLKVVDDRPITIASYERPNGKIKLYKKSVDTSWVNGESRLIVRHLAKAPNISMSYDGGPVFRDIKPGRSRRAVVPALPFEINITAETTDGNVSVLAPSTVTLGKNTVTVVYVVGDFEAGTARVVFHAYRTPPPQTG